jgi:hypothetical protein
MMGFEILKRDRRNLDTAEELLRKRAGKDRFLRTFYWMLAIELIASVGFAIADLLNFSRAGSSVSLNDQLPVIFGNALLGAAIAGSIVAAMAIYRLSYIKANANTKGRFIYLFGLYCTVGLVTLFLVLWLIF